MAAEVLEMAFRTNENQQISLDDSLRGLTERELKVLMGSWAEDFAMHIFPNLIEQPFSVLFADNDASKPNTPIDEYAEELRGSEAFIALRRMVGDQGKMEDGNLVQKKGREISPESM